MVPPLARPFHHVWGDNGSVSKDNGESLASWRSLASPPTSGNSSSATSRGATDSSIEEDDHIKRGGGRESKDRDSVHVVPRKKKTKKRKPPSPASLERQVAEKERERSERVANGLALTQERARRIQEEAQQQARARRQARREVVDKIKAQLERIEEVRARRSETHSSASMLSSCDSSMSRESSCAYSLESSDGSECLSSRSTSSRTSHREPWAMVDSATPSKKSGRGNQEEPRQPHQPKDSLTEREVSFLAELEARTRDQVG